MNRTYTISKENSANRGGTLERQKWDKQYNVLNAGLNSPNLVSNERRYLTNENNEIPPTWVEYSERPWVIIQLNNILQKIMNNILWWGIEHSSCFVHINAKKVEHQPNKKFKNLKTIVKNHKIFYFEYRVYLIKV